MSRRGGRLVGWLVGWRLALRLARREALRSRGRSVLALVMVALPVLAVTAADVVLSTSDISPVESLDRRLGSARADVSIQDGVGRIVQAVDPNLGYASGRPSEGPPTTLDDVRRVLGGTGRAVGHREGEVRFATDRGIGQAQASEVDLRDPLARGLVRLTAGRLPRDAGEVVVNQALLDRGPRLGDALELEGRTGGAAGATPRIVGIAESSSTRSWPFVAGPLGSLHVDTGGTRSWLVERDVSWTQLRALNRIGAAVLSRDVVEHPPPDSALPAQVRGMTGGTDQGLVTVVVLVVVMALLEVVLLAGPAFAVGARRQSRQLALLATTGATPVQTRRVVLAGGVVLGSVAAVGGVLVGLGAAALLLPLVQRWSSSWFGPFDVPWPHLLAVAGFGLLSAVLAAAVPAWIASRQDVVAVLAGRRGDRAPSRRSPVLGVVVLGAAVAMAAYGARHTSDVLIAGSAVAAVLAMILLVPLAVVVLARFSGRLPLVLRYALRDAARHRTRTVPAVAAVAATVAGVVALGIATGSDEAENRERYLPSLAAGAAVVTAYENDADWTGLEAAVAREVPAASVTRVRGVPETYDGPSGTYVTVGPPRGEGMLLPGYGTSLGASMLVSDGRAPLAVAGLDPADAPAVEEALAAGRVVAFTSGAAAPAPGPTRLALRVERWSEGEASKARTFRVPGVLVPLAFAQSGPAAVLPTAVARRAGLDVGTVALEVGGSGVTAAQEKDLREAAAGVTASSNVYVERGYVPSTDTLIVQLVLAALGAVLMLGGTLTATFLALSDARPDLATLAAVGASPRTRRGVAAAYALVVGLVGAVLGAAVGFVPGVAITWPLTVMGGDTCVMHGSGMCEATGITTGPFLDVPWLLITGLVVGLPLLTALVVGLAARSRLPLVARVD